MTNRVRAEDRECPLSTAVSYVGEWWTLLLMHDLFDGYTRFDEFRENLDISTSILTNRLNRLLEAGIVERRLYQTRPNRYAYHLTEFGRSLRPILVALAAWGNARLEPSERSMILVDAETGEEVTPVLVDARTGARVDGPDHVFTAGPAASEIMRKRYTKDPGTT